MLMKKIFILASIVGSTLLSSCDSILDVQPESTITAGSFWKSSNDATVYLNGIYSAVRKWCNTSYYGEDRGDSFKPGEIGPVTVAWSQELLESNAPSYRNAYNIIHHCNLLFYKAQGLKFSNGSELNNILAECHFLRAYTYFQLLRSWGEVPIIQDPTLSDDVELKPRSSKEDVMSFILKDLEDAIGLFTQEGYIDKNKASKPATYALKADALMWKAKVLGGGKQDLEAAIKMIDNVEASGVHLLSDYKSVMTIKRMLKSFFHSIWNDTKPAIFQLLLILLHVLTTCQWQRTYQKQQLLLIRVVMFMHQVTNSVLCIRKTKVMFV